MSDDEEFGSEQPLDMASEIREVEQMALDRDKFDEVEREFNQFLSEIMQN